MLCAHCVNSSAEFTPFRIHSIYLGRRVVQCEEWKSKRDSFIHIQLYVPRAIRPTHTAQTNVGPRPTGKAYSYSYMYGRRASRCVRNAFVWFHCARR